MNKFRPTRDIMRLSSRPQLRPTGRLWLRPAFSNFLIIVTTQQKDAMAYRPGSWDSLLQSSQESWHISWTNRLHWPTYMYQHSGRPPSYIQWQRLTNRGSRPI